MFVRKVPLIVSLADAVSATQLKVDDRRTLFPVPRQRPESEHIVKHNGASLPRETFGKLSKRMFRDTRGICRRNRNFTWRKDHRVGLPPAVLVLYSRTSGDQSDFDRPRIGANDKLRSKVNDAMVAGSYDKGT